MTARTAALLGTLVGAAAMAGGLALWARVTEPRVRW